MRVYKLAYTPACRLAGSEFVVLGIAGFAPCGSDRINCLATGRPGPNLPWPTWSSMQSHTVVSIVALHHSPKLE